MHACPITRRLIALFVAVGAALLSRTAAASSDGAGLFALPPDRVAPAGMRLALAPRAAPSRTLDAHLRWVQPLLREIQDLGIEPMILGWDGLGLKVSGRM